MALILGASPLFGQETAPDAAADVAGTEVHVPDPAQLLPSDQNPAVALPLPLGASAGAIPILTLNQERLFQETEWGRATLARIDIDATALAAENRKIEAELEAAERALTEKRAKMTAAEFAPLALEFDTKVEQFRTTQEAKSRAISRQLEEDRQKFYREAVPVLGELMAQKGASVILAEGALIVSRTDIDVTDEAIALIDLRLPAPVTPPSDTPLDAPANGPATGEAPKDQTPAGPGEPAPGPSAAAQPDAAPAE